MASFHQAICLHIFHDRFLFKPLFVGSITWGSKPVSQKKGVYIDGHEREDVVRHRKTFLKVLLRDVKARPEIILRALYAQRYVYRNTLILRMYVEILKRNARAAAYTYVRVGVDR